MYYIGSLLVDVLSSIMLKKEFFKKNIVHLIVHREIFYSFAVGN